MQFVVINILGWKICEFTSLEFPQPRTRPMRCPIREMPSAEIVALAPFDRRGRVEPWTESELDISYREAQKIITIVQSDGQINKYNALAVRLEHIEVEYGGYRVWQIADLKRLVFFRFVLHFILSIYQEIEYLDLQALPAAMFREGSERS